MNLQSLNNSYFLLRHGQSEANVQGIIISEPGVGTKRYGLSEVGREQVRASARLMRGLIDGCHILSSDFLRAQQSAEIAAVELDALSLVATPFLRERHFGQLEGADDTQYPLVWEADKNDASHQLYRVEPARNVRDRALQAVALAERQWQGVQVLLVAHGDVLQLLQTAFEALPAELHRSLPPLGTGEIRPLQAQDI